MKIAIISGSIRKGRKSNQVSIFLRDLLKEEDGVKPILLDIKEYSFPVMEERLRYLENPSERLREFSEILQGADGIIIVSPEYNGSYSGALKNTLDYFKSEYYKKAIGVVTVSTGNLGGVNASHHLLSWVLHVKAIPSPFKLMVRNVDEVFDGNGNTNEEFSKRARGFLDEFLWLTKSIRG